MGNVVQCCRLLSHYFKCQDAPPPPGPERSPLLSSDAETESIASSLHDDTEEDMMALSANPAIPALQPDNFTFPDLILSSNIGAEAAVGEPVVCLLVSEAEMGPAGDTGSRSEMLYSEVETQTEIPRNLDIEQMLMLVEVETQTERTIGSPKTPVKEKSPEINLDFLGDHLEAMTKYFEDAATGVLKETLHRVEDTQANLYREYNNGLLDTIVELNVSTSNHGFAVGKSKQNIDDLLQIQDSVELIDEQRVEEKDVQDDSQVKCEKVNCRGEEVLEQNVTKISTESSEYHLSTEESRDTLGCQYQIEEYTVSEDAKSEDPLQKMHSDCSLSLVMDLETALLHTENVGPGDSKQMTLFFVDKMFLEAPHIKKLIPQTEEEFDETKPLEEVNGSIQDIVDIQEMNFVVKIQAPGVDIFELQVSGQMLVAELHQVLMDHELTCQRTCFSLWLRGAVLDNLTELQCIQGLREREVIKVVEVSYTVRDAHLHLRHVKNLLRSLDQSEAYNGLNGCSVSYLNFITQKSKDAEGGEKFLHPPEYILPGCKDRPLAPLLPDKSERKKPLQCVQVLTLSSWNPPPGNRKMHGDLLYLNVQTKENKELNITASTRGFYINQSTTFHFNPKPAVPKILCHSLVELLSQVSPTFRKNFTVLQRERVQQHPYERIPTLYQTYTWVAPQSDHTLDGIRAEEVHSSHTGQDELTTGQSRDWNEELQGSRELPKATLQDRILREKSIFKTSADFTAAATRGAVSVVDGNAVPLNPAEAPQQQMFIWNNMFFSLGFDVSEHYRPVGGDTAAHVAALRDLRGTQAYASLDVNGLHTLGTAVVDYRGVRVIAQTIVPGLLEKTQEQPLVYGSSDYGTTVYTHPRFVELLDKTSRSLKVQRHTVLDHTGSPVELCAGVETKGIFGNDGRAYILDLLRTFPPDLNFLMTETEANPGEVIPKECVQFGYPRHCRHKLTNHRPELIEAFTQHRYNIYVETVNEELNEIKNGNNQESAADLTRTLSENKHEAQRVEDDLKRTVIPNVCRSLGSVSDSCFDIRFNPDVCSPDVRFPPEYAEEVRRQRNVLWDVAAFLISHQIPAMLTNCLERPTVVMDGVTLTSVLHQHGINMRYLGTVLEQLDSMEECERLRHVKRICVSEAIVRSAKHIFRKYLQDVDPASLSAAVSHFLNCFLGSSSCVVPESKPVEVLNKRRSRKRRSRFSGSVWAKLTSSDLWGRIRKEAHECYGCPIQSGSLEHVIEKHSIQRVSLLREICTKTGIQVLLREYVFESRHRSVFVKEDIMNMFPVVKHLNPSSSDASQLVQQAQRTVQRGLLKDGYDLISRALTLFTSVCGILHEDVCSCLRLQGRLSYILGHYTDAIDLQEKTVLISERVQGLDHPQTIQDYTHLALHCFAGGQHTTSLRLLYRARYLALLVCGEDHPQVALIDRMLGLVLHVLMEYDLSQKFLENALNLASKYYGATSLKHAESHHLLATLLESKGDFRSALQHEKEACAIYQSQVGKDHGNTLESKNYLKRLTEQAVNLQTALNQVYCDSSACTPTLKLSVPDAATILEQLNLTCDIVIIPLSAKVLDLRTKDKKEERHLKSNHSTPADKIQQC